MYSPPFSEPSDLALKLVDLAGGKPDLKPNKAMVSGLTDTLGSAKESLKI